MEDRTSILCTSTNLLFLQLSSYQLPPSQQKLGYLLPGEENPDVSRLRRSGVSPPLSLYALITRFLHTRTSSEHIKWRITSNFFSLTSSTYPTVGSDGLTCIRSHTMRHTQVVGLPWTSDRPVAEISTYTTQQTQKTDIHDPGGIRPRDPSNRVRPQTYALNGGKIKVFRYKPEVALGVPGG